MFEIFMMVTNGAMCVLSAISFGKLIYDNYNHYMHPELAVNQHDIMVGDFVNHNKEVAGDVKDVNDDC